MDFSRENQMEAVWALRTNDCHDSYPIGSRRWTYGLAPFKASHPELLMGEQSDWGGGSAAPSPAEAQWSAMDFGQEATREHIFGLVEEVATHKGYDVDVLAFEFFKCASSRLFGAALTALSTRSAVVRRYDPFFRESYEAMNSSGSKAHGGNPVLPAHISLMTDLMRRIRSLADQVGAERGRPMLVAVHGTAASSQLHHPKSKTAPWHSASECCAREVDWARHRDMASWGSGGSAHTRGTAR